MKKLPERVVAQKKKLRTLSRKIGNSLRPDSKYYWSLMYRFAQEELLDACAAEGITLEEAFRQRRVYDA